jgi:excisionase family DNA binding protein
MKNPESYLQPPEAAAYLGSSRSTLAKRRLRGDGPRFFRLGRAIRYRREDLDEWLASRAARSTSDYARRAAPLPQK